MNTPALVLAVGVVLYILDTGAQIVALLFGLKHHTHRGTARESVMKWAFVFF